MPEEIMENVEEIEIEVDETVDPTVEGEEPNGLSETEVEEEPKEELDPNLYDENGVPWKNRAKEYQQKYEKVLEKTTEPSPKQEPEIREYSRDEFTPEQVTQILESHGFDMVLDDEGNPVKKYRRSFDDIIREHNDKVFRQRMQNEIASLKGDKTKSAILATVDAEIRDEVKNELESLGISTNDPEKYQKAVEVATLAVKARKTPEQIADIENRSKLKAEKQKHIVAVQPKSTPQRTVRKVKMTAEEKAQADYDIKRGVFKDYAEYIKYRDMG